MTTSSFTNNGLSITYLKGIRDINRIEKHPTYEKAVVIYRSAREKLLDVNAWKYDKRLRDLGYALMNEQGQLKYGIACDGDYIRFKANEDDDHYSWVQVERILEVSHDDWKSFAMRLKSVPAPNGLDLAENADPNNANTNTLIIERNGNKVVSYVHQRSAEAWQPETDSGFFTRLRNLFTTNNHLANAHGNNWETVIDILME